MRSVQKKIVNTDDKQEIREEGLIQEDENRLDFSYHSYIAGTLKHIINDLSPQGMFIR